MELDGHPTQDIVEELQKRGARVFKGNEAGPDRPELKPREDLRRQGVWVFLPREAYETGFDDSPVG